MILWLCIVVRIVANPASNVFQKLLAGRGAHPVIVVGATHALLTLVCLPFAWDGAAKLPAPFWSNMAACAALAVASNVMLVAAVRISDLSLLGPINAWKPAISLVPGIVLLAERPGVFAAAGIGLVVAGSHLLSAAVPGEAPGAVRSLVRDRGVQLRVAALVLSALEAVFLKRVLLVSSPVTTFAWWSIFGGAMSLVILPAAVRSGRQISQTAVLKNSASLCLALAATTGLMQFSTLVVLGSFQVGPALALFQSSAILSVLLGRHVFREPHLGSRLAGSVVMVAGAVLIVLDR